MSDDLRERIERYIPVIGNTTKEEVDKIMREIDVERKRYAAEQVQLAQDRIRGLVFPKHEPVYRGDWSDVLVNIDDVFLDQITALRGDNQPNGKTIKNIRKEGDL